MKHFMAVMGTSLYEPVVYYDADFRSSEQQFVQLAMIEKYREALKEEGAKISLFVTDRAKSQNIENRLYTSNDVKFSSSWTSAQKEFVIEGEEKKGFKAQLKEQFPELASKLKCIPIEDALTEDQIWKVFNTIYNEICEEDEIIFDITHSFRSIPMLALTVLNYAKILKNCRLEKICYGAYDPSVNVVVDGVKTSPLTDLTMYDEILSWCNAANSFMRFGNATMMKELFTERFDKVPREEKKNWNGMKYIMNSVENLSDAIQTSRGVDGKLTQAKGVKRAKCSVKSAYEAFAENIQTNRDSMTKEIEPLVPLIDQVKKEFSVFDCKENYEVGMAVIQWAIDNNLIQQGYTALEETLKTYLCYRYGLDQISEEDRDDIAGTAMVLMALEIIKKSSLETLEERLSCLERILTKEERFSKLLEDNPEKKAAVYKMYEDDNRELSEIIYTVKDQRNDINHFGMRGNPLTAEKLRKCLNDSYQKFVLLVNKSKQ